MHKSLIFFAGIFIMFLFSTSSNTSAQYTIASTPGEIDNCTTLDTAGVYILNRTLPNRAEPSCFNITVNNVWLIGLNHTITIDGEDTSALYGIFARNVTNVSIHNLTVSDYASAGIFFNMTNNSIIDRVVASSNGVGISLLLSNNVTIINVSLNGNNPSGIGMIVNYSHHNILSNISTDNNGAYGIHLFRSLNLTVRGIRAGSDDSYSIVLTEVNDSRFINNSGNSATATFYYLLTRSHFNTFQGDVVSSQGGAYSFSSSTYNNVTNNSGGGGDGNAVSLTSSHFNYFANNTFTGNAAEVAIILTTSNNNTFEDNNLSSSEGAFSISGKNNRFIREKILDTVSDGVSASYAIDLSGASENNTFINLTVLRTAGNSYDLRIAAAINSTEFIDTNLANYTFGATGNTYYTRKTNLGEVRYTSRVTGSGTNLSTHARISSNSVIVDSSFSGFNKAANISLFNLATFSDPAILRDDVECSSTICTAITSLNAGNVTFQVTGFSTYAIGERPSTGGSSSGGGGGGGGSIPSEPADTAPEEEEQNETLPIGSCTDSDGGLNYNAPGVVTQMNEQGASSSYTDACINSTMLLEYACTNTQVSSENHACEGTCTNSACKARQIPLNKTMPLIIGEKAIAGASGAGSAGVGGEAGKFCGVYAIQSPTRASASSVSDKFKPGNAIDGDSETRWHGDPRAEYPKWIAIDLGEEKCIKALDLFVYQWDIPLTADIQVSNDQKTWTTVISGLVLTHPRTIALELPQVIVARYLRVYETSGKRPFGSLSEITLHAAAYTSNQDEARSFTLATRSSAGLLAQVPVTLFTQDTSSSTATNLSATLQIPLNALTKVQVSCPVN
ncbi:discoidin domain-containing protein [Candidatus Pacearchaeota archaeon]|nr:discoidin domain-containing protein [Candidatus Pacearchaeota archaeon]